MQDRRKLKSARSSRRPASSRRSRRVLRLVITSVLSVCAVLIAAAVISKAARPYLITYRENRDIAQIKTQIAPGLDTHEARLAMANTYMLNPSGLADQPYHDALASLSIKRQMAINEATSNVAGDYEKALREMHVTSRFDLAAYRHIADGTIPSQTITESHKHVAADHRETGQRELGMG